PRERIERRVPELLGVHLREALVSRDRRLASTLAVVGALVGRGRALAIGGALPVCRRLRGAAPALHGLFLFGLALLGGALVALGLRERLQLLDRLVALVVRIRPAHFLAELQPVQRWLADVDATLVHQRTEMPVEQSQ